MKVDLDNLVSITEANRNFSSVARMVNERGTVVIMKNNEPRYVLMDYSMVMREHSEPEESVQDVGARILEKHMHAFEELAK